MIHGFTVPASVEIAMREKGYVKGLFGWITAAPWRNPAFSGMVLSVLIFGFVGGITGVTLGTQQINIIAHNTLRITGHFHATVVGGTTLAFMALTYYVIPLVFRRDFIWPTAARLQPWLFGGGILLVSFGMSFAGSLGVPRRIYDIEHSGAFGPAAHLFLGMMGIGAILAVTGLFLFCILCVGTLLAGERNHGRAMRDWGVAQSVAGAPGEGALAHVHWAMKGTIALTAVFLASFAVYYFANWKALADVWPVK
jgi:cytochrome c oxidase subunit 1